MITHLTRYWKKPDWHNLRSTKPISKQFGFDRGMPIDRFFIEHFLAMHRDSIKGTIMEIADPTYSKQFAQEGSVFEVLYFANNNRKATIIGDLTIPATLPHNKVDCFICTQTLNFIYDFKAAIAGIHHVLKPNGVALVTVAGISQISRYDMSRWGDYWRFTELSMRKSFEDFFGAGNVNVDFFGNVLTSVAFLEGLAAEELTEDELLTKDEDYQMLITVVARKC